ncbi:Uma2 family endonuclease [Tumidithrix elongata RA019]|uniref:Uma2 family endonuclease n=1 Tax=Tumidithrix elongata BACA0141 TaxID=2716417 RepID=A0AAW9Q4T9_9CYAN|nr:Uma2 family endonuclease [Tumidithrix elongata RA019]
MTVTAKKKLTFEEYLTYDDGTNNRYEFRDGALIEMPPATGLHNRIIMFLAFYLQTEIYRCNYNYCVRANSTEVFIENKTRRPDICILTKAQDKELEGKPDILFEPCPLAIEIVSPSSRHDDFVEKRKEYSSFGIPEYWIVDLKLRSLSVLTQIDGDYVEKVYKGKDSIISPTFPTIELTMQVLLEA